MDPSPPRMRAQLRVLIILLAALLIQSCASTKTPVLKPAPSVHDHAPEQAVDIKKVPDPVPRREPKSLYGNPESYEVWGKRYYVMDDARNFVQKGIASWYGSKFHGRRTSSGEIYDMYAMTAAHKSLPLPCYLQVKNLENGRTIVVRVNDRGPFHEDRIIDLSYTAALKLGIVRAGTGYVEIRDITPSESDSEFQTPLPAPSAYMERQSDEPPNLYVQIGAFKELVNANKLIDRIRGLNLSGTRIKSTVPTDESPLYRVQLGPVQSAGEAQRIIGRLAEFGLTSTRLVEDSDHAFQAPLLQ